MSSLERLIALLADLEAGDAQMPLSVLLPLYRHRLAEPYLTLLKIYNELPENALDVLRAATNPASMYDVDVALHYNDIDIAHDHMRIRLDNKTAASARGDLWAKFDDVRFDAERLTKSSDLVFLLQVLFLASQDKEVALKWLPAYADYLDEVVDMVESGYSSDTMRR